MAFSSIGGNGHASRRRGGAGLAEINITPFVDILLVLLIIFMLTAHVMEYGLEVDVPQVRYVQNTTQDMPVVTIDKTGDYTFANGIKVNINDLVATIHNRYPAAKGVYVQADKDAIWDLIAQVDIKRHFDRLRPQMLPNEEVGPPMEGGLRW